MSELVIHTPGDPVTPVDLRTTQENIGRAINPLLRRPHLNSELLEREGASKTIGLTLAAGVENLVDHGLGRDIRGWFIADITGPVFVWRVASPSTIGASVSKYLTLGCSADTTVKLVVF